MSGEEYRAKRREFFRRYYEKAATYFFESVPIDELIGKTKKDELFFLLLSMDHRRLSVTSCVSSIDKHKRYARWTGSRGSKVCMNGVRRSMFDIFEGEYEKALLYIKGKLRHEKWT